MLSAHACILVGPIQEADKHGQVGALEIVPQAESSSEEWREN